MIRKAIPTDFKNVYEIHMDDSVNPYMKCSKISEEEFKEVFNELLNDLVIYERDDKVLAMMVVKRLKDKRSLTVYVGTFAVHPDFQGQGIATEFFHNVTKNLKKEGIKRIELIVELDNPRAIKFYQKSGFKIEATMRDSFNREGDLIDDYIMALML